MDACCDPAVVPVVVLGTSVLFRSGPFEDADGDPIDFTTWDVALHLEDPEGEERTPAGTPSGTDDGYLEYTTLTDELDEPDLWEARLVATSGSQTRASALIQIRVEPVLP